MIDVYRNSSIASIFLQEGQGLRPEWSVVTEANDAWSAASTCFLNENGIT